MGFISGVIWLNYMKNPLMVKLEKLGTVEVYFVYFVSILYFVSDFKLRTRRKALCEGLIQ